MFYSSRDEVVRLKSIKSGRNWIELENGIYIFGYSGEIRPAGDTIEGEVRPEHWLINTPEGLYGMPPHAVAAEMFSRPSLSPIVINPLTAVRLYLDKGISLIDLERAEETENFILFTIVRNKYNFTLAISDGTGLPLITRNHAIVPAPRPEPVLRDTAHPVAPQWVEMD